MKIRNHLSGPRPPTKSWHLSHDFACELRTQDTSLASMGPRSEDRGKAARHVPVQREHDASMGPRSEDRGKLALLVNSGIVTMLQWGRDPKTAESHRRRLSPPHC